MKLRQRYAKLTFWNKVGFWGSVASLLGLLIAGLTWLFFPSASPCAVAQQRPAVRGTRQARQARRSHWRTQRRSGA